MRFVDYFYNKILFFTVKAAHLEGEEAANSLFDGIDSEFLIGNWYKIVIIAVAIGCLCGFVYSNIKAVRKKKK